jgi:prolyl-tRNA synthetase
MRWSEYFMPTSKQTPKEAETVSHKLMLRAGLIDKVFSGVYSYLPAGYKVLRKVENIIRQEMNAAGACELLLPALQPTALWKESGRLEKMGEDMVKFTDRHGRETLLGPTHEEIITDLVRKFVSSWKQLPVTLYQIQTKFRDEVRPRFGIIRSREFLMKDAYSFDMDEKGLQESYMLMKETYKKIFTRCGLKFEVKKADSGVIGGKFSEEFFAEGDCEELEVGHIFKLGTEYSETMKCVYTDKDGKEKPVFMGCYGIGVSRIVAAVIEGSHDNRGIIWPASVAPFDVLVIPVNMENSQVKETAEKIYAQLTDKNIDVLLDDRTESPGSKFSDAELCGIPLSVIVGKKIKEGKVEMKTRKDNKSRDVKKEEAADYIYKRII